MNLLADESVEFPIIQALKIAGHRVESISELSPSITDEEVLDYARRHLLLLLTIDKDFGDLVFRLKMPSCGIVLLRMPELKNKEKIPLILDVLEKFEKELTKAFSVVTANKVRVIKL